MVNLILLSAAPRSEAVLTTLVVVRAASERAGGPFAGSVGPWPRPCCGTGGEAGGDEPAGKRTEQDGPRLAVQVDGLYGALGPSNRSCPASTWHAKGAAEYGRLLRAGRGLATFWQAYWARAAHAERSIAGTVRRRRWEYHGPVRNFTSSTLGSKRVLQSDGALRGEWGWGGDGVEDDV